MEKNITKQKVSKILYGVFMYTSDETQSQWFIPSTYLKIALKMVILDAFAIRVLIRSYVLYYTCYIELRDDVVWLVAK